VGGGGRQNWTAEIIATSADALAVNPGLWPAICHSENLAPYATVVSYRSVTRPWSARRKVSLPSPPPARCRPACFQHAGLLACLLACLPPGKYRGLMCHQQIITRCRHRSRPRALPPAASGVSARGEKFLSPGRKLLAHKDDATPTRGSPLNGRREESAQ